MDNLPLISIITVSYNAISTIEKTICSVLAQTYSNIEYIIIDGGSTDGTVEVIKKYNDKLTYWVSEPDKGIYDAMNKGIDRMTGDWVNFMNSGDLFYSSDVIEKIVLTVSQSTEIAYGDTMVALSIGTYLQKAKPLKLITQQMVFGHQASFVKARLMKKWQFDISFRSSGDYNFFYNSYKAGCVFQYIPIKVVNYEGEMGMSVQNHLIAYKEDARIHGIMNTFNWKCKYFIYCLVYEAKKNIKAILPLKFVEIIRLRNANRHLREI